MCDDDFLNLGGGAVLAMAGKQCVVIASDNRFGIDSQTVSTEFPKAFCMGPTLYLGLTGFATDIQTVSENMKFIVNLYELNEHRKIKPSVMTAILSNQLYAKRFGPFYVESVVAGLEPGTYAPYLATLDILGSAHVSKNFAVIGSCKSQLYGMCEPVWAPDMDAETLFQAASQALLAAVDRDAVSGWGATVCMIEPDKVTTRTLKTRMD